jgi:NDP-sugar pyrophosphorylase family protein
MSLAEIDVAILAGGLGTRLKGVLGDQPKVMADVGGRPFLSHLLDWLLGQGARHVTVLLGYRAQAVIDWLSSARPRLMPETVIEPEPLGTAGAIAFALPRLARRPLMVINGDTRIDLDLSAFLASHEAQSADASLAAVRVPDAGRYGRLELEGDRVMLFAEKDPEATGEHWINGGVYVLEQAVLDRVSRIERGSLERDVLQQLPPGTIHAYCSAAAFLDIGTPETLREAQGMAAS